MARGQDSPEAPTGTGPPGVLHVVTRYTGGSVRRLLDVIEAIDGEHRVAVGPGSDPRRLGELDGRAEVIEVPHLRREVSPVADGRALVELVRLVRRQRPDVVHTHQSKAGLLGRAAARAGGVGTVYHSASMASFGPGYGRVESAVFRVAEALSAPMVTRYFVVGHDLARRLRRGARVPERKLTVVRSFVDVEAFAPVGRPERDRIRAGLGLAPDAAVVAYVGSLEPRKNVVELPAIAGEAASRLGRPLTLLVAGDGPERTALEGAEVPDVDVRLLGHVGAVADVLRAADVVALPSSAEGVPQVLVQAGMVGVPFVAYDVDGVEEVLVEGSIVGLGDTDGFARALAGLLNRPPSGPSPDPGRWTEWDSDVIHAQYRRCYSTDLGRPL